MRITKAHGWYVIYFLINFTAISTARRCERVSSLSLRDELFADRVIEKDFSSQCHCYCQAMRMHQI